MFQRYNFSLLCCLCTFLFIQPKFGLMLLFFKLYICHSDSTRYITFLHSFMSFTRVHVRRLPCHRHHLCICVCLCVCEAHISQVIPNVLAFFRLLFNTGKCVCTIPINNNNSISGDSRHWNRNCLAMTRLVFNIAEFLQLCLDFFLDQ